MCHDSLKSLVNIVAYFIDQIIEQPAIEEVELLLPESSNESDPFDQIQVPQSLHHVERSMTDIVIETEPLEAGQFEHFHGARALLDAKDTLGNPMVNTAKDINFNLLGTIDEHMFSRIGGINDIGIDSSSEDEEDSSSADDGGDDADNGEMPVTGLIQNYARAKSEPDSVSSLAIQQDEYVDLEEERNLTTPFNDRTFGTIRTNVPPVLDARDQSGGWYAVSCSSENKEQQLDVHYLDKKLQEKFHCLIDPNLPSHFPKPLVEWVLSVLHVDSTVSCWCPTCSDIDQDQRYWF